MNTTKAVPAIDIQEIAEKIKELPDGQFEYIKKGHGKKVTDRPLAAIRLELALDEVGMRQNQLHRATGVAQPIISRYISGKISRTHHINKIANYLGLTAEWLMGEDSPEVGVKVQDNTLRIGGEAFILISKYISENHSEMHNTNEHSDYADYKDNGREIKTMISAKLIDPATDPENLRFIVIDDRSCEPDFRLGGHAIFDTSKTTILSGDYYVIKHGNMAECVRKLYREPNGDILIKATRQDFPDYSVKQDDQDFKIIGRVMYATNTF